MKGTMRRGACPKCQGTIYTDHDEHGWYEKCLQCGYTADLPRWQPSDAPGTTVRQARDLR